MTPGIYAYIFTMAAVTYAIRVIPLTLFSKQVNSKFIKSFLYYVPYVVLAAMTFPAVFYSTGSVLSAVAGCVVALFLAYAKRGLLTVAVGAALTAFLLQLLGL